MYTIAVVDCENKNYANEVFCWVELNLFQKVIGFCVLWLCTWKISRRGSWTCLVSRFLLVRQVGQVFIESGWVDMACVYLLAGSSMGPMWLDTSPAWGALATWEQVQGFLNQTISIGKESYGPSVAVRSHFLSFVCEFWCSCLSRERRQKHYTIPTRFSSRYRYLPTAQVHATEMASSSNLNPRDVRVKIYPSWMPKLLAIWPFPIFCNSDDPWHTSPWFSPEIPSFAEIFAKPETRQFW